MAGPAITVKSTNVSQPVLYQRPALNAFGYREAARAALPAQLIFPDGRIGVGAIPEIPNGPLTPPSASQPESGSSVLALATLAAPETSQSPGLWRACALLSLAVAVQIVCVGVLLSGGDVLAFDSNVERGSLNRKLYSIPLASHVLPHVALLYQCNAALNTYAVLQAVFACLILFLSLNSVLDIVILGATLVCWRWSKTCEPHVADQLILLKGE